jgi:uncharacterized membrane protein YuzA (DUF378 family)
MFGRKNGLAAKMDDAKSLVQDSGQDVAKRLDSTSGRVEAATGVVLVLGVANWISTSIFNFDAIQAVAGRKSKVGRAAYGLLGASALYAAARGGSELSKR